ncbi:MAG: DUF4118 domain-containing protein [Gemmatimonadetes bacterium]|nr:DUF4118 domain-containing protein [Gemmatimonadota bacterium]
MSWVGGAALLGLALRGLLSTTDIAMLFLLAIAMAGVKAPRAAGIVAAVVGIGLFDLLFVPPYGTFAVSDAAYLLTFLVMLGIALAMTQVMGRHSGTGRRGTRAGATHRRPARTGPGTCAGRDGTGRGRGGAAPAGGLDRGGGHRADRRPRRCIAGLGGERHSAR